MTLANSKAFANTLAKARETFNHYAVLLFLLFLTAIYGFVGFEINASRSAMPTDTEISDQSQAAATPHIDATVVSQIDALQDHSVNVNTLFEQARQNPFHE